MDRNLLYRKIPKVDSLLENETIRSLTETYGIKTVMSVLRGETDAVREMIRNEVSSEEAERKIQSLPETIAEKVERLYEPDVRRVINATGTILHTNLGRAPLPEEQALKTISAASGYTNLEYNLESGKRGERYDHFEKLLCRLSGAEAAMAVNNNAAALMLILHTLAKGKEVIVSRGELVEIGGCFRIPEVMELSGARLAEVGTTNKTRLRDYENAVSEETRAILKVHTSNYRIIGFTESVPAHELKTIAETHGLPLIEDLGSGVFVDLEKYGLTHEPTVQESISAGADVVCFSGDKLLGGPQAGIIAGRKQYIDQMKRNPLSRALRIDKLTVAALELVLMEYLHEEKAPERIPVLKMLLETEESVRVRAEKLCGMIRGEVSDAAVSVEACLSQAGGGSLPGEVLKSAAVVIRPYHMSVSALEREMRHMRIPVIGRIADDAVRLDVRTIGDGDFEAIAGMLGEVL